MRNTDIAKVLLQVAELLELLEDSFKPRAYRRAARSIENLEEDVTDIAARGELEQIPGVGKAIAKKIQELLDTGRLEYLTRLTDEIEPGLVELLSIPGVGPKTVRNLRDHLGITSIEDLEKALATEEIRNLPGFSERREKALREALVERAQYQERLFIGTATPIAEEMISVLRSLPEIDEISIAGSLRRWRETIGDIDILVASKTPSPIMEKFIHHQDVTQILAQGPTKTSVIVRDRIQLDLRVVDPESFGAALQYFTGSKAHNIALRRHARKRGWKLNEYGLFHAQTQEVIASRTEESIYQALGMSWIPPELREDNGEIELALQQQLPPLITLQDIRGDLHVHTKWSDGADTIEVMATKAIELGYEYLGICDHSSYLPVTQGLDEHRLRKQINEIRKIDEALSKIHLFSGIEVDILPNGSLDLPDKILAETDLVIAAIHTRRGKKLSFTERVIKACENEYVDILAHPTGRILTQRQGYSVDLEALFECAKENDVILEINSSERLDLPAEEIRRAKTEGLIFAINTDAHNTEQMAMIQYGVGLARRGWLERKHVVNAQSYKQLRSLLKHPH